MVHGLFRASGIVMFYGLHHDFRRRKVGVSSECLGHFWRAEVGRFWKAPKRWARSVHSFTFFEEEQDNE
jgi:hypothetical protein